MYFLGVLIGSLYCLRPLWLARVITLVLVSRSSGPSTLCGRNLKTKVSLWKRIKGFPSTLRRKNLTMLQSPVILDLCLRKTLLEKSHDYRNAIVLENLCFHNVFRSYQNEKSVFWNSSDLKSVFEKLRFSWRISVDGRPNGRSKSVFKFLRLNNLLLR